jgi:hypothetical protein
MRSQDKRDTGGRASESGPGTPNPVQIQKFLGGIDYPAAKAEILQTARSEGADERVMAALERIPDRQYDSPVSVSREVGKLE